MSVISSLQNAASGLTVNATNSVKRGINQTLTKRGQSALQEATANSSVAQAADAAQAIGSGVRTARNIATAARSVALLANPAFWVAMVVVVVFMLIVLAPAGILSGGANNNNYRTLTEMARESGCDLEAGCTYKEFASTVTCSHNAEELRKKYGKDIDLSEQFECKTETTTSAPSTNNR